LDPNLAYIGGPRVYVAAQHNRVQIVGIVRSRPNFCSVVIKKCIGGFSIPSLALRVLLDHPLEPVIGRREEPTRWRVMMAESVARSYSLHTASRSRGAMRPSR
jgi:hypothetical protein